MFISRMIANYLGQFILMALGFFFLPLYYGELGSAGIGLIGYLNLIISFLIIFDFGFSPAVVRFLAVTDEGENALDASSIIITFEIIFIILGLTGTVLSGIYLTKIGSFEEFSNDNNGLTLLLILLIVFIRWLNNYYKICLQGLGAQVAQNAIESVLAMVRYGSCYFGVLHVDNKIHMFLMIFTLCNLIEVVITRVAVHNIYQISRCRQFQFKLASFTSLKPIISFSYIAGLSAIVWAILINSDKLIVSTLSSSNDFGNYTMIITISSVLILLSRPINLAVLPSLVAAVNRKYQFREILRKYFLILTTIALSAAFFLGTSSNEILFLWTGDGNLASWGGSTLTFLVYGNAYLLITTIGYVVQSSHGNLRMHLIGTFISAMIQVPILLISFKLQGIVGLAISWMLFRALWMTFWLALVLVHIIPIMTLREYFFKFPCLIFIITAISFLLDTIIDYNLNPSDHPISVIFLKFFLVVIVVLTVIHQQRGRQS